MVSEPEDTIPAWALDFDETDPDDEDDRMQDCGMMPDGQCMLAGTEWCDWDCPRNKP